MKYNICLILLLTLVACGSSETDDQDIAGNHCTTVENTEKLLIDYSWGNQINGSSLTVMESGAVIRMERVCCGTPAEAVETPNVSSEKLTSLQQARDKIVQAHLTEKPGVAGAMGLESGSLYVYDGNKRCLAAIHPNDPDNAKPMIQSASATEAVEMVRIFVTDIVDQKMK